jgi:hypothetical protein|tara:strand:+ start:245 stop:1693 length:1449 start_codon:yes stop_codon:yes gene_type:complete
MVMSEMGKDISIHIIGESSTQMDVASGGGGGTSNKAGDNKKDDKKKEEQQKGTSLKKLIGIDISLAAMLKQSQIFTGFLGSVFQLIGMLVDVILAPLAPYLFKLVDIMASWIPKIGKWSQDTVNTLKRLFDNMVGWFENMSGVSVNASDLVKKGFQLVSIQGMSALIGEQFAMKFGRFGKSGWSFTDLFAKADIKQKSIIKSITASFGKAGTGIKGAIGGIFSAIFRSLTAGWGAKLMNIVKALGKGAKILGAIGMIIGIAFEIQDIIESFKGGNVGEAIVKIALLVLGVGVPLAVGFFFAAIPALIAGIIIGALALMWEYAVPPDFKQKIYKWIENLFGEIKQVFADLIDLGEGSVFSKIINGLMKLFTLGPTLLLALVSMVLSEGIKRNINDGVRSLADSLINGLIDLINGLIRSFTDNLPDWIPGIGKARDFQIGRIDFSDFNLMGGTDRRDGATGMYANEWAAQDLSAVNAVAMYQDG